MNLIFSLLLKPSAIRSRILLNIKCNYFHEFGHSIPLGNGFWADLLEVDSYDSFSEIFIQREYEEYLPSLPIFRILDIGAHYGYFSLWLQSMYPDNELSSIMIEPSPRCSRTLKKLIGNKRLCGRFYYLKRMIGNPQEDTGIFYDRPYMSGSSFSSSDDAEKIEVPILKENDVQSKFPAPYDLIKCDIEGSEVELLTNYSTLIKNSKYLLLEWHSWDNGGKRYSQIKDQLYKCNFEILKSSPPLPSVGRDGVVGLLLAENISLKS